MKNTKKLVLIVVIGMVFLLASCSKSTETAENTGNSNTSNFRQGGFRQNQADLYGEVKNVSGSQITIALLEMPQRRQVTDEERKKMQGNRGKNHQGQQNANSPSNNDSSGSNNNNRNNRPQGGRGFTGEKKYTGKTETISVTGNTPITTFDRGNGNFQEKDLKLSDIKTGSIIQVWYKDKTSDKKEIDRVRILQTSAPAENQK